MFIYLGMTPKYQNCMHEEIKSRLLSGNSCYMLANNNFSIHLQSSNIRIKIYINIILSAALHGCKTWSVTPRKGYRLMVFDKREEATGDWRRLQNEELNYLCCSFYYSCGQRKKNEVSGACSMRGREENCIQAFGGGYLKKGDYLKHLHTDVTMYYNCLYLLRNAQCSICVFSFMQKGTNYLTSICMSALRENLSCRLHQTDFKVSALATSNISLV